MWEGNRGGRYFSDSEMVTCPYNRSHVVKKSKFPYHLVKCAQSHPEIKLETCPFNASHRVTRDKLVSHVAECPSKEQLEILPSVHSPVTATSVSHSPALVSSENWDDEYPSPANASRASYIDESAKCNMEGTNESQIISSQSSVNFHEKSVLSAFYPVQSVSSQPNSNGNWLNLRLPKSFPRGLGPGRRF